MSSSTRALIPLVTIACGGSGAQDIEAVVSDAMGTVVEVSWTTSNDTTGHVEFGADGAMDRVSWATESGTDHVVTLVGLPPDADVDFRVVVDDDPSDDQVVSTGTLPVAPPGITVQGSGQDHFLVAPLLDSQAGVHQPAVIDPQGRVVWIYDDPYELEVFRAHVALDGSGIVYSSVLAGGDAAEGSKIVRLDWEGNETAVHDVDFLTHDFVELDDGTLVSLAALFRDELEGNKLVSIGPDGATADLWNTWDCFDPETHPNLDVNRPTEWTHANALDYDSDRDAFVIGFRNLNMVAHIDRASGECDWSVGGPGGDVDVSGGRFRKQHQFHWTEDSLLVFDNQGAGESESRAIEYAFDPVAKTATVVNEFLGPRSPILGDVHRFDNGDTQVVWSVARSSQRLDANGEQLWQIEVEGVDIGFAEMVAEPGRPTDQE